jgi:hypothetical protein
MHIHEEPAYVQKYCLILLCSDPDVVNYITKKDAKGSYPHQGLPGYDHRGYDSPMAGGRIENHIVGHIKVNGQDK